MVLSVVVLLVAMAIGYIAHGSLRQLGQLRFRSSWLVLAALVAQLVAGVAAGPAYQWGLGLSVLLIGAFLTRNRGVRGMGLVALGLLLNAVVVGANGAMPVSADASGRAGLSTQRLLAGTDPRHQLAGPDTQLRWLGDVIPVLLPLHPQVISVGDLLVAAGLGQLIVVAMTRRREPD